MNSGKSRRRTMQSNFFSPPRRFDTQRVVAESLGTKQLNFLSAEVLRMGERGATMWACGHPTAESTHVTWYGSIWRHEAGNPIFTVTTTHSGSPLQISKRENLFSPLGTSQSADNDLDWASELKFNSPGKMCGDRKRWIFYYRHEPASELCSELS